MPELNYDPKLRVAIAEVEEVLKKHDIAGFVALGSKTHSEFKFIIEHMSWSNIRFLKKHNGVHIKLHMESKKVETEATVGVIMMIRDLCAMAFMQCEQMADKIKEQVTVVHVPFGKHGITNDDRKEDKDG